MQIDMPCNVHDLIDETARSRHRRSFAFLHNPIHCKPRRGRAADGQLRPERLLYQTIQIHHNLVGRDTQQLKAVRNRRFNRIGPVALREVGEIHTRMEVASVCRNKEGAWTAHTDRHRICGGIHQIAVRRILNRHGHGIAALDRRVLIVHHIEPEHNRHNDSGNLRGQIVLHDTPKPRHHFFLQLRIMSRIDERAPYAKAGVSICVS